MNDAARSAWLAVRPATATGGRPACSQQAAQRLRDAAGADDRRAQARGHLTARTSASASRQRRRHVRADIAIRQRAVLAHLTGDRRHQQVVDAFDDQQLDRLGVALLVRDRPPGARRSPPALRDPDRRGQSAAAGGRPSVPSPARSSARSETTACPPACGSSGGRSASPFSDWTAAMICFCSASRLARSCGRQVQLVERAFLQLEHEFGAACWLERQSSRQRRIAFRATRRAGPPMLHRCRRPPRSASGRRPCAPPASASPSGHRRHSR